MPIGSDLNVDVPNFVVPPVDSPTQAAAKIVDALEKLVAACEGDVPGAALDISAELDFQAQGATGVAHVGLDNLADENSNDPGEIFRFGNDLFFVHPDGVVKITDGTGLNAAGIGGIGGDYGTGPESVEYENTTDEYSFLDAPGNFSDILVGGIKFKGGARDLLIRPTLIGDGTPQSVTIDFPAGTTKRILGIHADEKITWITDTDEPFTFVGVTTFSGAVLHGQRVRHVAVVPGYATKADGVTGLFWGTANIGATSNTGGVGVTMRIPILVERGERLLDLSFRVSGDGTNSVVFDAWHVDGPTGTRTAIGTLTVTNAGAYATYAMTVTDTDAEQTGDIFYVDVTPSEAGINVGAMVAVYDKPNS